MDKETVLKQIDAALHAMQVTGQKRVDIGNVKVYEVGTNVLRIDIKK
jgi:hypothetical protein